MSKLPIPSEEQSNIIKCFDSNIVVNSVAGSGKTTTVLHFVIGFKKIKPDCKILLLTYNKKLKIETKSKVNALVSEGILWPNNLEVHTYHGFACRYYARGISTDHKLLEIIETAHSENLPKYDYIIIDETQDMIELYYKLVCATVRDLKRLYGVYDYKFIIIGDTYQNIYGFKGANHMYISNAPEIFGLLTECKYWKNFELSTSYRINNQTADFINTCMLGHKRLKATKNGEKPSYHICDTFGLDETKNIVENAIGKYGYENIFIIAYSIKGKKNNTPIETLVNRLSAEKRIPIFVPGSDEEKLDEKILAGKLVFSTMHQTKGLERKCVIIFGFDDFAFKDTTCPNILYVAATRASEKLILLHHNHRDFMPFINVKQLHNYCIFSGNLGKTSKKLIKDITLETSKLTDHKSALSIKNAYDLIKWKIFKSSGEKIKLSNVVDFNYNNHNLLETTAEINGVALMLNFEHKNNPVNTLTVLNDMRLSIRNEPDKYFCNGEIDLSYKNFVDSVSQISDKQFNNNEITKIAKLYCAYRSGFMHKLNHLDFNNWITDEQYNLLYSRISSEIGKNCLLEGFLKINYCGITIAGRFDIFDLDTNTLWEIKAVSELKPEHYIQTAIYGCLLEYCLKAIYADEINDKECKPRKFVSFYTIDKNCTIVNEKLFHIYRNIKNGKPLRYKLFNILSNEIIEIDLALSDTDEVIKILLDSQPPVTDNFIDLMQNVSNRYLNEPMNTSCMIRKTYVNDDWFNDDFDDSDFNFDEEFTSDINDPMVVNNIFDSESMF